MVSWWLKAVQALLNEALNPICSRGADPMLGLLLQQENIYISLTKKAFFF